MKIKKLSQLPDLGNFRLEPSLNSDDIIEVSIKGPPGVNGFSINDGVTGWASIKLKISQLRKLLFSGASTDNNDITPSTTTEVQTFRFSNQYLILNVGGNVKYIPLYDKLS